MDERILEVNETWENERLDVFLAARCDISRSYVQKLLLAGLIFVQDKPARKAGEKLKLGHSVCVLLPPPVEIAPQPEDIPLDIVYEDDDLIVINKPQGMVVHPAAGNQTGTLVNALLAHCSDLSGINGAIRPGIVHRLDKDTSGLLVAAKNDQAHRSLAAQIADKTCKREYYALVEGKISADSGTVDAPIGRLDVDRKKMGIRVDGRPAVTDYIVEQRFAHETLVRCMLRTGRTHQIRVHMAHIGHPVVGDPVYGYKKQRLGLTKQALHAYRLSFAHPRDGRQMDFTAPLPEYFAALLKKLR